jgi:hypothetical protein
MRGPSPRQHGIVLDVTSVLLPAKRSRSNRKTSTALLDVLV